VSTANFLSYSDSILEKWLVHWSCLFVFSKSFEPVLSVLQQCKEIILQHCEW
jgi:hypothetical protein